MGQRLSRADDFALRVADRRTVAVVQDSFDEVARRQAIEVALDQCWDLLRQRRARRDAGQDPDDVQVRPEDVVERYQQ